MQRVQHEVCDGVSHFTVATSETVRNFKPDAVLGCA